ncbi:MAG TPA: VOC family protein [Candidatus Sulfotelmatobacter sp.]|nr:VOC family protein [Candidatus Sulfotelmatobacter sp.]
MASGIVVLASSFGRADDRSPSQLDHVILGCKDLDAGIDFVEERTGIRAARGGVHPDRGTANALLSLGERHYLEIMAPDPNAKSVQTWAARQLETLKGLARPRLIGWAVHTNDMQMVAKRLRDSGLQIVGPYPGSRARPDGKVLHWQSFSLADDLRGLLPFFIEWGKDSVHPSSDAPGGCRIERFALTGPDTAELSKALRRIEVEASVEQNPVAQLHIRIAGPKGDLEATS